MTLTIFLAVVLPGIILIACWWAHRNYDEKIHMTWRTHMGDDSLDREVEDSRITKLNRNDPS